LAVLFASVDLAEIQNNTGVNSALFVSFLNVRAANVSA
jgi:hypothetical protein